MPEQDTGKEQLGGIAVGEQDSFKLAKVRAGLVSLTHEIAGLPGESEIHEGEVFAPIPITDISFEVGHENKDGEVKHSSPNDSRVGHSIFIERSQKKAAA